MRRRTAVIVSGLAVLVAVSLAYDSCRSVPQRREFAIGMNQWVGFAPFFLAKERGYFADLPVSLNFIDLEGDKRAGLYSGRLQMICETIDMFQSGRDSSGYDGIAVFAVDESSGGDGVLASSEVKDLGDLKGRTVALEPGQPAHFVLQYLLHQRGLTLADIRPTEMTSADAAAAFIAGRVDVAGTYQPYLSQALAKRKDSHILVSTKDLPGLIVDAAIVSTQTLKSRRADVEIIFQGWARAVEELRTNPTAATAVMAKAFGLSQAQFNDSRSGLHYLGLKENRNLFIGPNQSVPVADIFSQIGDILRANKLTRATDSGERHIDPSVVAAAKGPVDSLR